MNINLMLEIADLALAVGDQQLNAAFKGDSFFETALVQIIQKAVQAYQDYTGQPLDPSLIKPENPA